ncbi:6-phospho-3-hexuloisomerase [Chitinophaga sp. Cy-1792]|uniref:6-phospho-3-hexuloisomerase n=1 Tax=Chitinophaga sp. Cy-1792 TaxID=2608339 RepID=UPI001421C42B|nr:6-phospho-3-hexuloisomerase [Chitinophaga sp. Cy-1792]NIG55916.1 6-phospho-3-hexuloisomerase [Chitinophaga sp. Cy-1792]
MLSVKENTAAQLQMILAENMQLASRLNEDQLAQLVTVLQSAGRIFIMAAGRSGLSMKAAAMRLMHLGLNVYVAGETTTPAIAAGDLLLAASGSGTTASIVNAATKARAAGASIFAISTQTDNPLVKMADYHLLLPAAAKQDQHGLYSAQYAGSLFEQALLLVMDATFQVMWQLGGQDAPTLWKRHANME